MRQFVVNKKCKSYFTATAASELKETLQQTPPLKASLKKQVLNRDQCCQYQDPVTREKCESKYFLEVDHIQPRWAGGQNEVQNLRILCRTHNQYRYEVGCSYNRYEVGR